MSKSGLKVQNFWSKQRKIVEISVFIQPKTQRSQRKYELQQNWATNTNFTRLILNSVTKMRNVTRLSRQTKKEKTQKKKEKLFYSWKTHAFFFVTHSCNF
jgi:hypothetical protein